VARIISEPPNVGQVAAGFNANATAGGTTQPQGSSLPPVPGGAAPGSIQRPNQDEVSTVDALGSWNEALQAKYGLTNVEVARLQVRLTDQSDDTGTFMDTRRAGEHGMEAPPSQLYQAKLGVGALVQELSTITDPQEMQALQQSLFAAGFYGTTKPENVAWGFLDEKTVKAYTELLVDSTRDGRATTLSWQNYLNLRVKSRMEGVDGIPGLDGAGPTKRTTRQIQEIDPGSATAAFRAAIGREPSGAELDNFMATYNTTMRKNAQVTVTEDDGQGNVTQTVTGGYDPQQAARDAARKDDDFAAYQAVSSYMPALQAALRGSVSSGQAEL
jgi:hypothetical protein